jgi:hypothetical protein
MEVNYNTVQNQQYNTGMSISYNPSVSYGAVKPMGYEPAVSQQKYHAPKDPFEEMLEEMRRRERAFSSSRTTRAS